MRIEYSVYDVRTKFCRSFHYQVYSLHYVSFFATRCHSFRTSHFHISHHPPHNRIHAFSFDIVELMRTCVCCVYVMSQIFSRFLFYGNGKQNIYWYAVAGAIANKNGIFYSSESEKWPTMKLWTIFPREYYFLAICHIVDERCATSVSSKNGECNAELDCETNE